MYYINNLSFFTFVGLTALRFSALFPLFFLLLFLLQAAWRSHFSHHLRRLMHLTLRHLTHGKRLRDLRH